MRLHSSFLGLIPDILEADRVASPIYSSELLDFIARYEKSHVDGQVHLVAQI